MLVEFLAGFLGVVCGAGLVSYLFYWGYLKERKFAQEAADKLFKLMTDDPKQSKNATVLSLLKKDDKDKPLN